MANFVRKPGKSYNSNQFFKFSDIDGNPAGPGGRNPGAYTNQEFIFPGDSRRHLDADGEMVSNKVERGFMRLLPMPAEQGEKNPPNYRLFFQFNPQTITREIESNQSNVYSALLQTPEQLSQPLLGQSSFSFDLMFDRSFELNEAGRTGSNPLLVGDDADKDLLSTLGPRDIGVLHDIRMLDAIVGQGITKELVKIVRKRAMSYDKLKQAQGDDPITVDPTTNVTASTTDGTGYVPANKQFVSDTLALNVGNQAILVPNPVRVAFSSLFMVDGFVTGMSVRYVKFNNYMTPMTALVNIRMQAVYFGFARTVTPFTYALENASDDNVSVVASGEDDTAPFNLTGEQEELKDLFDKYLSKFWVALGGSGQDERPRLWHENNKNEAQTPTGIGSEGQQRITTMQSWEPGEGVFRIAAGFTQLQDKDNDPIKAAFGTIIKEIRLENFKLEVKRGPVTNNEGKDKNFNRVMFAVEWEPSSDTTRAEERFRATGSEPSIEWDDAQYESENDGGGVFKANKILPNRALDAPNRDKFFLPDTDYDNNWDGLVDVSISVQVVMTHEKGGVPYRRTLKKVYPVQATSAFDSNEGFIATTLTPGSSGGNYTGPTKNKQGEPS